MSHCTAKVICDTYEKWVGTRIITMEVTYPHIIHNQLLTHRMLIVNTAMSGRGEPTISMIDRIKDNPFVPTEWPVDGSGQFPREYHDISSKEAIDARGYWLDARDAMIRTAEVLSSRSRIHKEITNRLLEMFSYKRTLVTATSDEWRVFFDTRSTHLPQNLMRELAWTCIKAIERSSPAELQHPDQWHLPYVTEREKLVLRVRDQIKLSYVRCYRVSMTRADGTLSTHDEDFTAFLRLLNGRLRHEKPAEHQRKPSANFRSLDIYPGSVSLRYLVRQSQLPYVEFLSLV